MRGMLILLACGTAEIPPAAAPIAAPGAPSIVWISLDTVRADHLSVYGGRAATPNLEALAKTAVVYEQAYSHFPETALSHWSMLTGVLPEVHGNVPGAGTSAYSGPTAAEIARDAGYRTAAFIGGVTLLAESTGLQRGFELYDDRFAIDRADMKRPGAEVSAHATKWITAQTTPYFAFVHYFDAHFPYTPAEPRRYDPDYAGPIDGSDAALGRLRDRVVTEAELPARDLEHVVALYDAELTELDAMLAPLLGALKGDEIVVVTADHGESFENGYLFNHRGSLGDGVLHVPLIVRAPGVAPTRVTGMVGLMDVLPTVVAAAKLTTDAPFQGRSMLPTSRGRDVVWARTDPWMVGTVAGGRAGPLLAARTPGWKAIWGADGGDAWDLAADPGEARPVAIPDDLAGAPSEYAMRIAEMAPHQQEVAGRRIRPPGETELLEQLGYLQRDDGPQGPPLPGNGPPGPPPPGSRPPPGPPGGPPPRP